MIAAIVNRRSRLIELAQLFLKLGIIGFGGPAAHIALMEDEVVRKRVWLTRDQFMDLLGAVNLIPGPNSTEMAIHIGLLRAGGWGAVIAGSCFILPAFLIVLALAMGYASYGSTPQASAFLYGLKPVIVAIIGGDDPLWANVTQNQNAFHSWHTCVCFRRMGNRRSTHHLNRRGAGDAYRFPCNVG